MGNSTESKELKIDDILQKSLKLPDAFETITIPGNHISLVDQVAYDKRLACRICRRYIVQHNVLPCGHKKIRGHNADYQCLDEAVFISKDTLQIGVFPVSQQNFTATIAISTPKPGNDEISRIFHTINPKTGKTIFSIVRIGQSCDECKQKEILCVHEESASPDGLSHTKRELFQEFYKQDMQLYRQEFLAEVADSGGVLFQGQWMLNLIMSPPHKVRTPIDMLFVTMDPAQGGKCGWGFCACYYDVINNKQVIVMLDEKQVIPATPGNILEWLKNNIFFLRALDPAFRDIPIVIACEAAPNAISEQIADHCQTLINSGLIKETYLMYEQKNERPGVPKTNANTQMMVKYFQFLLEFDQVRFSEVFNTNMPDKTPHDLKQLFCKEANNFRIKVNDNNRKDGRLTVRMDGKDGNNDDDMMVAVIMQYYWYYTFMNSNHYEHIHSFFGSSSNSHVYLEGMSKRNNNNVSKRPIDTDRLLEASPDIVVQNLEEAKRQRKTFMTGSSIDI